MNKLASRELIINTIVNPAGTLSRAFKHYTKGFIMPREEMQKLLKSIQDSPNCTLAMELSTSGDELI